jgi:PEP-CTERM motif
MQLSGWVRACTSTLIVLTTCSISQALQTTVWTNAGTGDFGDPSNWTLGVPDRDDNWVDATINNGGTAVVEGLYNVEIVTVGSTSTGQMHIKGDDGVLSFGGDLFLGKQQGSLGTITLTESGRFGGYYKDAFIGYHGQGRITQYDNSATNYDHLRLGEYATGSGVFEMYDGVLDARRLYVGVYGQGTFIQHGGQVDINRGSPNYLNIGHEYSGTGRYELRGGSLYGTRTFVGSEGTGEFIQTGGKHNMNGYDLYIGSGAGSDGLYELSGLGWLERVDLLDIGHSGQGEFHQHGGYLSSNTLIFGDGDGKGAFTLTGWYSVTETGELTQGANGTLRLQVDASGISSIKVFDDAVLNGELLIEDLGAPIGEWEVIDADGQILENFSAVTLPPDWSWRLSEDADSLFIAKLVPEPATLTLLVMGLGVCLHRQRVK